MLQSSDKPLAATKRSSFFTIRLKKKKKALCEQLESWYSCRHANKAALLATAKLSRTWACFVFNMKYKINGKKKEKT